MQNEVHARCDTLFGVGGSFFAAREARRGIHRGGGGERWLDAEQLGPVGRRVGLRYDALVGRFECVCANVAAEDGAHVVAEVLEPQALCKFHQSTRLLVFSLLVLITYS